MKVLVELTLGHRATIRDKITPEGFTHDWEVYVKGDQGNIQAFVDRVIFTLHETFPKPRRVVKEPPYSVKEAGYAGFIVNIEILFKNKDEPKKAEFSYDLYLQSAGPQINPSRKEKLIFNYPKEEFIKKLIKGGGNILEKSGHSGEKSSFACAPGAGTTGHHSGGGKSKPATATSAKVSPKNSFENLFGTPIKRSSNAPVLTSSASVSSSSSLNPTAVPSKNGSSSKEKAKDKSSKHDKLTSIKTEMVKSPVTPETTSATSSSSKSTSSSKKSEGKKEKGPPKKMPPPSITSVPKKVKIKQEIFTDGPSPSSKPPKSDKSSKSSKNLKVDVDNIKPEKNSPSYVKKSSSDRDRPSSRSEKPILSPISSSSSSSSCTSSASSPSAINSEEDSGSEQSTARAPPPKKSPNPPSSSSSRKRAKKSRSKSPTSATASISSPAPSSASSSSSLSAASAETPVNSKKRKGSSSSSRSPPSKKMALEKSVPVSSSSSKIDYREGKKSKKKSSEKNSKGKVGSSEDVSSAISPILSPGLITGSKSSKKHSTTVVAAPAENSNSTSSRKSKSSSSKSKSNPVETTNSRSSASSTSRGLKSSKNHERELSLAREQYSVDENDSEALNSDSSSASFTSDMANGNGPINNANSHSNSMGNSPGVLGNSGFSHAGVAGSITAEMKLLKELHSRISLLIREDPMKLQEIVDIVESSGKDSWSVDTGLTFDFDLCKLSSSTIKRLKQAVL